MPLRPPFANRKISGTVVVRRFGSSEAETSAEIRKGKLVEPLAEVAGRIGLREGPVDNENDEPLSIVDEQGLVVMSNLVDGQIYYMFGGTICEMASDIPTGNTDNYMHSLGDQSLKQLEPDAIVCWAFDERVLDHDPHSHRSPETPYRLERAVELLQTSPRASEILPKELRIRLRRNHAELTTRERTYVTHQSNRSQFIPSRMATNEEILAFQDEEVYREFLQEGTALPNLKSDVYCNDLTSSIAVKLSVAAVIDGGVAVLRGVSEARCGKIGSQQPLVSFCLVRPPGHHCTAKKPSGFCLVNNVAIAAKQLLENSQYLCDLGSAEIPQIRKPKIGIIDLDVHYGEGTASFVDSYVSRDSTSECPLLYLSVHRYDEGKFYPCDETGSNRFTGRVNSNCICNVAVDTRAHLPGHCEEVISDYLLNEVMERVFIPRLELFSPDVVFVSLGFDAAYGDPLGRMAVSGGFAMAMSRLKSWCLYGEKTEKRPPSHSPVGLVTVLEGGYNPTAVSEGIVSVAHALTFPSKDVDVARLSKFCTPSTWGDLRQKQLRRLREWDRSQLENAQKKARCDDGGVAVSNPQEEGFDEPKAVEEDAVLLPKHLAWCSSVVTEALKAHTV